MPEIQSKQVWGSFHIKLSAYFKLGVGGEVRDNNRQSDISVCALRTCHESSGAKEGSQTMTRSKGSVGCFNDRGFMWFLWVGERERAVINTRWCRYHFWVLSETGDQERQTQGGSTGATGFRVLVLVAVEQNQAGVGNLFDKVLKGATLDGRLVVVTQYLVEKYLNFKYFNCSKVVQSEMNNKEQIK